MKFLILSDIHGSSYYFHKVLEFYKLFKCDKMLILGDLLYHGPRNNLPYGHDVKQLVELLNSFKDNIICVKGNCDAEVDEMVLDFPPVFRSNALNKPKEIKIKIKQECNNIKSFTAYFFCQINLKII